MSLNGLHHVTAITAQVGTNLDFYTRVLGLRLVKRTVNQDDVSAYHLFYADKVGSPGTDITFFDWPHMRPEQRGTDSIATTIFRVNGRAALDYWRERLNEFGAMHSGLRTFAGRDLLYFTDPEGQRLALMDDGGAPFEGELWDKEVPADYALRGFYATLLVTPRFDNVRTGLIETLDCREGERHANFYADGGDVTIFEMGAGGPGRELWIADEPDSPLSVLGAGGVHHLALRVADSDEQIRWHSRIRQAGLPVSDVIDRFYFQSIYFRISRGILFEIATDGPGFAADENLDTLGEALALPPFLEPQRRTIEAGLRPIVTA